MAVSNKLLLLEIVRQRIRLEPYNDRTEKSYMHGNRGFVQFHSWGRPCKLGKVEITSVVADNTLFGPSAYSLFRLVTPRSVKVRCSAKAAVRLRLTNSHCRPQPVLNIAEIIGSNPSLC
jgi:hypothetical protein